MDSDDSVTGLRTVREPTLTRYDLVLAVIPLAFLAALALAAATAVALQPALASASGLSAVVVADALFLRPPGVGGGNRTA